MNPAKAVSAELTTYLLLNYFKSQGIPFLQVRLLLARLLRNDRFRFDTSAFSLVACSEHGYFRFHFQLSLQYGLCCSRSLSAVDRDAPPRDAHDSGWFEEAAIALMRADKPVTQLAEALAMAQRGI